MLVLSGKCKKLLEARVGIEPTHKGFADLSLTTWVPRLGISTVTKFGDKIQQQGTVRAQGAQLPAGAAAF
jgi:hypothetical protein